MKRAIQIVCVVVVVGALGSVAMAEVNIETVPVRNPGNAGEWSGQRHGGFGPDRICGAVDYDYRIGKYVVTAGQYRDFLNAVDPTAANADGLYNDSMDSNQYGCQITRNSGSSTYDFSGGTVEAAGSTAADWANRPVNYISWYDAAMFANWATSGDIDQGAYKTRPGANWGDSDASAYTGITARDSAAMEALVSTYGKVYLIPTEDEWYKAAYYDGGASSYYDYPTSSDLAPSNDLVEPGDPGNNATFHDGDDTIGSPYYRTEVGAHEKSDSPYLTFDQGGNVGEWNEAIIVSSRGSRGGAFSYVINGLNASVRDGDSPTHEYFDIGFRVSEVPEPATMATLALGAFTVLRKRRKQ